MAWLNSILTAVFDALLAPFAGLPPIVGLGVVSLLVGVAMLLVYKRTSDQERLEETKRQIHAGIFEVRLFGDDLGAVFRAQLSILRHNLTYLRLSMVPMLWMIVPLFLLLAQMQFHYGYQGLAPESTAIVKVKLKEGVPVRLPGGGEIGLELPDGLLLDSPPLWIPGLLELDWRIRAIAEGEHEMTLRLAGEEHSKSVRVSGNVVRRSPRRPSPGLLDQLLFPVEPPLPADSLVESIEVTYPDAGVSLLGWETHWIVVFFILTIVVAFALRKPFDVTI